ncbi:unnamed protein product [Hymenolepis diminuta]|uniref:Pept_C1 domain-containing protein n=1 Tax=Hymenolepis diminuta TaxID=6216 RepID=A0A0R3SP31_HYMDI|nr:unnamed protein product [Hymenolepis diminuta]
MRQRTLRRTAALCCEKKVHGGASSVFAIGGGVNPTLPEVRNLTEGYPEPRQYESEINGACGGSKMGWVYMKYWGKRDSNFT